MKSLKQHINEEIEQIPPHGPGMTAVITMAKRYGLKENDIQKEIDKDKNLKNAQHEFSSGLADIVNKLRK